MKKMCHYIRRRILGHQFSHVCGRLGEIENQLSAAKRELRRVSAVLETAAENPAVFWLFANRAERMDANVPIFPRDRREFHMDRYRFAAKYAADLRVADIACGTGYGTACLVDAGKAREVVGVDLDGPTVAYANAAYGDSMRSFVCAPAAVTGLKSGAFDLITSFETLEHVPNDLALLSELARLLKPGGLLIISTPNDWDCTEHPHHKRSYDRQAFEKILKEHFKIDAMHNQNSGSAVAYNHGQSRGITPTTHENEALAECYIAVCRKR